MTNKNQNSIMIVSIDEHETNIVVQNDGETVQSSYLLIGTRTMDEAVAKFFREELGLLIGRLTAKCVRTEIGSAIPQKTKSEMCVRGRNLKANTLQDVTVTNEQISKAIADIVRSVVNEVRTAIEQTSVEVKSVMIERGILLRGEGGKLRGLDSILLQETKLPITVA
ncbi:MAG: rod shape-determining protein [Acidobacteriota bacterium]|nr:rod shape-determining protein [Acidobacteriota bacterium]